MAIGNSGFEAIKDKARKMIHDDAKRDSHIIRERQADRNNPKYFSDQPNDAYSNVTSLNGSSSRSTINENYYEDDSEARLNNAIDNYKPNITQQQTMSIPQDSVQASKVLPKEILESFGIGQTTQVPQQVMQETYVPQQQITSNGKVDYEIIKNIVEGTVKKYINALGKKMLTESKSVTNLDEINAIQITDKKIAIVTKNGNLFEGKLEFKKNIKGGN